MMGQPMSGPCAPPRIERPRRCYRIPTDRVFVTARCPDFVKHGCYCRPRRYVTWVACGDRADAGVGHAIEDALTAAEQQRLDIEGQLVPRRDTCFKTRFVGSQVPFV